MKLRRGIYFHLANVYVKKWKLRLGKMIIPVLHINHIDFKKQHNPNEYSPKKKSVTSFQNVLDKEVAKVVTLKKHPIDKQANSCKEA
jgi:hypothetical protein